PAQITVRVVEPETSYRLEFYRVEVETQLDDKVLTLTPPAGTAVERLRGIDTWHETGIPILPPKPDG
ncbi:MAG: hypothetical protein ACYDA8_14040, partial [Deferrisomatales bacterium]